MKFSIIATALLAQGIVAMPWSSFKETNGNGEEITVRIQVSGASDQVPASKPFKGISTMPLCLKVCWPDKPTCPEGWEPKKMGGGDYPCWTCCRDYKDEDL
ncbi:pathogenicity [Fusarium sporotrichioides]|uniref:Pathogenicity n=1 Tax=Fusarium sporotrichioides TaxID=5514 RepID=A0A395S0Q2_FUSSP|nr:pathogenicity [Fusarium sporotrichioides]